MHQRIAEPGMGPYTPRVAMVSRTPISQQSVSTDKGDHRFRPRRVQIADV